KKDVSHITSHVSPAIIVGTHALLSEKLQLTKVGLVVIDEQQRFGVEQRGRLRTKSDAGQTPHFLTMTATPIPRTVAKTLYSHLDLSLLAEMPKGRQKVKTWVVPKEKRERAYAWIRQQLKQWQTQAFIVCPLIEESESLQTVKAATVEFERLKKEVFPDLRLGLLHGRLKPKEKKGVIARFRHQELDILVTTPVVEVGIDIPDATIMLIEASERFGLSQLHQLRGRVGRGLQASYCLLFTEMTDDRTFQRLKSLETIHNGPELAELDLKLRGPGELFGTKQHGLPELKIASLADSEIIYQSQQAVHKLMEEDATLAQFPLLREKLEESKIEAVQD
ncbi:MAG: helicase-related protein, partial [Patescibacteria group bacterium]